VTLIIQPETSPAFVSGSPLGKIAFGGDYNPEQWTDAVAEEDIALMHEAGVNLVSVGIFSWTMLEPEPGRYDFRRMDEILDRLHRGGISVDLATPTAAPPQWFLAAHPDSVPVRQDGTRAGTASRQVFCPSSPEYREAAAAITRAIVDRYHDHPAVVMWHVHNEYGCHNGRCYCDGSAAAFRQWLKARYGTLDALNDAWGNAFWSQTLTAWDQVVAPRTAPTFLNPAHELDYARFSSDELLACYTAERDIIKAASPDAIVTTNLMAGQFGLLDYWKWAAELDMVSTDHYLFGEAERNHVDLALAADLTRSLAHGRPWLLMEHSTGAVNWQPRNIAKRSGEMARNSLTHLARGADGILFFQWRASIAGAEKYHSAMLPHAGTDSRIWRETRELGEQLSGLASVAGSRVHTEIAILFDYHAWWAADLGGRPSEDIRYADQIRRTYDALWDAGYTVDFAHPESDLSRYRLVVAPALYLVSDAGAANIASFHDRGGSVVVGYFSGIVDSVDRVRVGRYPGAFRELLGASSDEFLPLRRGQKVTLSTGATASLWSEPVRADDAEIIARYTDGPAAGAAAITRRQRAWYVSTQLAPDDLRGFYVAVADSAGIARPVERPEGVEVVERRTDETRYLFVINHTDDEAAIDLPGQPWFLEVSSPGRATVSGDGLRVPPGGVGVLRW